MKKATIVILLLCTFGVVEAQDFKKVQTFFLIKKMDDAKKEIDVVMKDPKALASPEAWLWKARVYGSLFNDSATRTKYPGIGLEAFDAFNKYMTMDASGKILTDAGLTVVDQIYVNYFNIGRAFFDKEMWDSSLANFKIAYDMGEYITKRNWRNNKQVIDTFTVLFTGYAAQNAKKGSEATMYYQKFADLKIGGKPYQGVYDFLTKQYLNTKNKELFTKYNNIAKELYPEEQLWKTLELAFTEENASLEDKLKMFADAEAGGKLTADDYITYGNMFFNVSKDEAKAMDSLQMANMKKKAAMAFQKAYEIDNKHGIAAYNSGVVYNNEWNDLRERFVNNIGNSPALKAKRDAIDIEAGAVANKAIEWLEKAYSNLDAKADKSKTEKNSLTTTIKMLANLYEYKRDKSKGKVPGDYDKYNNKFTFYNSKI